MLAVIAGAPLFLPGFAIAQADEAAGVKPTDRRAPIVADVDFGSAASARARRRGDSFRQIGLLPNQTVRLTVQYPPAMAGEAIIVEPLDGGVVTSNRLVIAADGRLGFVFKAGALVGESRITLYNGETTTTLMFWVRDTEHPERNPASLAAN